MLNILCCKSVRIDCSYLCKSQTFLRYYSHSGVKIQSYIWCIIDENNYIFNILNVRIKMGCEFCALMLNMSLLVGQYKWQHLFCDLSSFMTDLWTSNILRSKSLPPYINLFLE